MPDFCPGNQPEIVKWANKKQASMNILACSGIEGTVPLYFIIG